jgi:plastocyanin
VSIVDRAFSPSSIRVAAGGTITFTNSDDRPHTVTANDGSFDSGIMNAGARYARRFATAGTYRYFCAVHPEMTGTVTVPTATGSVPAAKPAARGGSAGGSTGAGSGGSGIAAPPPIPSASAASIRVNVIDFAFDPAKATARVGDTISWVNTGRAPHTVTPSGGSFGTSMLAAGATYRTVAKKTGTFAYVCAFHPQMTGTLVVLPKSAALPKNDAPAPKPVVASATPAVPPPGAAPAAPAAPVEQAAARRSVRPVATSWTDSPLALWSLGSGWALLLFLALAWWRHQEPKGGRERG